MTIQSEKSRIERLVGLCKLWSAIKFFHPYLAYRDDIDWDAALITAVPKANSADNAMDYANAIQQLLSALNDPATRVTEQHYGSNNDQSVHAKEFTYTSTQDRLLIVSLNNYQELLDFNSIEEKFRAIKLEIPDANGILFDLRATAQLPEARGLLSFAFNWSGIATVLSATPYFTLNHRSRMHQGFVPQSGATSGDYASSFRVIDGRRIMPVPNSNDIPMVWLVNAWSELPPEALALQRLGKAMIIVEGEVSDAALVKTHRVLLYDDVVAEIRLSEVVGSDDFVGFEADAMIPVSQPTGQSDQSLELALSLLRDFRPGKIVQKSSLAPAVSPLERSYSEMQFPPVEYRLMAAFRIWSVINYFFPYKALIEEDWDDVLREFILKMEQVDSALAYHLAVAEMITHIHDSHGFVGSPILDEHFGVAGPPIRLQWIDNMPVVTAICDQEIVNAAGLSLGDVILKIDGGDIQGRIEYCAKYKAVSTPQQRTYHAINRSLFGLDGTTVVLTIQDRDDAVKDVILPRSAKYSCHERSGAVFRPGGEVSRALARRRQP